MRQEQLRNQLGKANREGGHRREISDNFVAINSSRRGGMLMDVDELTESFLDDDELESFEEEKDEKLQRQTSKSLFVKGKSRIVNNQRL